MLKTLTLLCLGLLCPPLGAAAAATASPGPVPLQAKQNNPKDKGITGRFSVQASDNNKVKVVEFIAHPDPKTPLLLLFHDGSMNRAEYRYIAPRLNRMGFNCMAPDLRAGKNNLGHKNQTRTNANRASLDATIMAAKMDMQAVLTYARESYPEAPIILIGCSYSASHALRLAGEMPAHVDGVVAFSPAEFFGSFVDSKTWIADGMRDVRCPVLITSAGVEKEEWEHIYAALPEGRKHMHAPSGGVHGVRNLGNNLPSSKGTWKALTEFFDRYYPRGEEAKPSPTPVKQQAPPDKQPEEQPEKVVSLERMVVLGASVSMGFFLPAGMDDMLEAGCRVEHEKIRLKAEGSFAWNSMQVARKQVEFAKQQDPTLVVAADFLFWMGYGALNARGEILESEAERLELLESGLELLEGLECPLVVGDFPDMSHASGEGYMIATRQLPEPQTLELLNQRLGQWAEQRGRVRIVPLKSMQLAMNSNQAFELGHYRWPAGSESRVLQRDRLHPTLEGLAALAHAITYDLVESGWSRAEDWDLDLARVLGRFDYELAGLERNEPLARRE